MKQVGYINLYEEGILEERIKQAFSLLESCCLCPHRCGVNRIKNQKGFCRVGFNPIVASYLPHHGEEPPISGFRGSGAIFFSYCNLRCIYCQNYEFSQLGEGREVSFEALAGFMLELQKLGCHNINLVTPTHFMPQILKAISLAIPQGLNIPIVYNTGGYELVQVLKLLDGIVDIYMPDMRYGSQESAKEYSSAWSYPEFNQQAVKEMNLQVGVAKIKKDGIIEKGLIIRHLILPGGLSSTEKVMEFIAKEISTDTYISLMSQYFPCYLAKDEPILNRRITLEEYRQAQDIMTKYNLYNGWVQESYGLKRLAGINIKPLKDKV